MTKDTPIAYIHTEIRVRKTLEAHLEPRPAPEDIPSYREARQNLVAMGWREVFASLEPLGWADYERRILVYELLAGFTAKEPYRGKVVPYPGVRKLLGEKGLLRRMGFAAWMTPLELRTPQGQLLVIYGHEKAISFVPEGVWQAQ